jgi:hypothetical protein
MGGRGYVCGKNVTGRESDYMDSRPSSGNEDFQRLDERFLEITAMAHHLLEEEYFLF